MVKSVLMSHFRVQRNSWLESCPELYKLWFSKQPISYCTQLYVQLSPNGLLLTGLQTGNNVCLSKRFLPENLLANSLMDQKVHNRVYKISLLGPLLGSFYTCLKIALFWLGFPTKILYMFLNSYSHFICLFHIILFNSATLIIFMQSR
jgi:hypothetical protein